MSYRSKQDSSTRNILFPSKYAISTLVTAMAMATPVVAEEAGEEDTLVFQEQSVEIMAEDGDARMLRNMADRAGITLTPETIKRVLEMYPEVLDAADSGERDAILQEAAAIYPARFEVTGQAKIYEDTSLTTKNAGGRFASGGIDVLLNYSSILGGISYENMALWGTSHSKEIEAKLAVDAEFEAYGVYGRADAGPPPYPAVTYGVYGTTNQHSGFGGYFTNTSHATATDYSQALYAKGAGKNDFRTEDPRSYVATVEATNTSNASMLAIYSSDGEASGPDTFIGFIGRNKANTANRLAGEIRGVHGASENGIEFMSYAADFAEYLPRVNPEEHLEAGDVVGVVQGKISRDLRGAHHVQVISTSPIVSGNMPEPDKENLYEPVAFIGQVPVKVKGVVKAGDYIVASGNNDGTGIAIATENMTPDDYRLAVGQAWESSDVPGVKLINTAVGLAADDAYAYMKKQDQRIASLEQRLANKTATLDRLAAQMEALTRKVAYIQAASMAVSAAR